MSDNRVEHFQISRISRFLSLTELTHSGKTTLGFDKGPAMAATPVREV